MSNEIGISAYHKFNAINDTGQSFPRCNKISQQFG